MFGHKIRAWMDNIVRTKKSKSKKHSNVGGIMVGSPTLIRRSEISPLQNTTGGRAGWKTPDSPVHSKIEPSEKRAANGDDRFRYNYRSDEVKKVIIETRPYSRRSGRTLEEKKHYSSEASEFGSVMNYISSPESASTGYSTLHSDDCLFPATIVNVAAPKPECYADMAYHNTTPSLQVEPLPVPTSVCPSNISYVNSPSPRQRSRIRTNPWYKTVANNNNYNNSLVPNGGLGGSSPYRSQSNCSSPSRPFYKGCDIELKGYFNVSPNSLRKRKLVDSATEQSENLRVEGSVISLNEEEDDSTLKEIMGRFDEISYTYDKETDILSDSSDHTQCQEQSDYEDTGQEAEDEYEEEEIDYIDKNAVSISDNIKYNNSGSCEYYVEKPQQISRASLKMRKRMRRTRKRSECSTPEPLPQSNGSTNRQRECRSVGGTPILKRRAEKQSVNNINTSDRSNSLTTLNSPQKTLIRIAESEKQLLQSDLEAFMKYRELINEAETILGSFKVPDTNSQQYSTRNTPPHLPNKRVEMLRAEVSKRPSSSDVLTNHHSNSNSNSQVLKPPGPAHKLPLYMKPHSPLPIHKKIELLKQQEQYTFGPPSPSQQQTHQQAKVNAKENYPPPNYSPKPLIRSQVWAAMNCPKSEPLKRKVYVPPPPGHFTQELMLRCGGGGSNKNLKQEMIMKTLEDLKRSLTDQKTQLYTLNEKP